MSKIKVQGNASGSGTLTIEAPNTNTDRVITLPDETVSLTGAPAGLDDVGGVARATSGLLFNGDTAAANALDDYETGTFTPTIVGTATTGTGTYSDQSGHYTKIGNVVNFWIYVGTTAHTGTGYERIHGLPFVIKETLPSFAIGFIDTFTYTGQLSAYGDINQSYIKLRMATSGGNAIYASLDPTSRLMISGSYKTT